MLEKFSNEDEYVPLNLNSLPWSEEGAIADYFYAGFSIEGELDPKKFYVNRYDETRAGY